MKDGELNTTSTHGEYTAEMSKKTVINRACKTFINSSDDTNLVIQHFNSQDSNIVDAEIDAEISDNANTIPIDMGNYNNVDTDTGEIYDAPVAPPVVVEMPTQTPHVDTATQAKANTSAVAIGF
jgi:recombination protein RecT